MERIHILENVLRENAEFYFVHQHLDEFILLIAARI